MAFGIEIYGPNGNTLLSMSSRVPRFVQQGTFNLNINGTVNTSVTGMANNDSWDVFAVAANAGSFFNVVLNTDLFTTRHQGGVNTAITYWVTRS